MLDVLDPSRILGDELVERREAGYELDGVEADARDALASGEVERIERVYEGLLGTSVRDGWPYVEPSALDEIRALLPPAPDLPALRMSDGDLFDRLLGAWLGRCAGCNLGKPVEGWSRARIRNYLDVAVAHPIVDYLPVVDDMTGDLRLNDCWPETTRGNIASMARDDDIDYTIVGLHVLEEHGFGFGADDVAAEWIDHIPFAQVYTAERAAYRNLAMGLRPPETATHRNPYREWIGAQIRADMWGYVAPGRPRFAAALAHRDASLSHTQNGIYGEMWAAALIASCFVVPDVHQALAVSLSCIPLDSRLAEALRNVAALHAEGLDWEPARDRIEELVGHYGRVHTVNNAAVVAAALLWGEGDFTRTIGLAVEGGWDTDCNAATAGSVFGALHGARAIPGRWVDPLHDLVRSAIMGFDGSSIRDLADRTLKLARAGARIDEPS